MIDTRELILARLPIICVGITGIEAVGQNQLDVPGLARPAIIINDGSEDVQLDRPNSVSRFGQVQIMDLTPDIRLLLRADMGADARKITSMFRGRLIVAILGDAILRTIIGANGAMKYGGCSTPDPSPETKEPRHDFTFIFTYPLKLSDLT